MVYKITPYICGTDVNENIDYEHILSISSLVLAYAERIPSFPVERMYAACATLTEL